jgi:tetratricopeptide (TPR) repeat protein
LRIASSHARFHARVEIVPQIARIPRGAAMSRRSLLGFTPRRACAACLAAAALAATAATRAQIAMTTPVQADLLKLESAAQGAALAEVVRGGWKSARCALATVSLEKSFDRGAGGWRVECIEGTDYWVVIPAEPKRAATVLPCMIARTAAGNDCYANLRTPWPGIAWQCGQSPFPDRAISACTAIIQSGRLADQPAALSGVYQARGTAFARYQQYALALSDLDRGIAINPRDAGAFYNRAVTLARSGDLDQAIRDLDEALRLRPDDPAALYERGYAYLRRRDYDRAIGDFDRTIGIDPKFGKAFRERSAAWRAKGDAAKAAADAQRAAALDPDLALPDPPPPLPRAPVPAPAPAAHELGDDDRQAAYCMEASFAFTQRYARLVARIRHDMQSANARLDRPGVPAPSKDRIRAQLKPMTDAIAANEAVQKRWQANGNIFIEQLKRRGLLEREKVVLVAAISQEVGRDEQAISTTHAACLRQCTPNDPACKAGCDDRAARSDASRRMLACDELAARLK